MSRHKLVKALDLEEEMDDFDGDDIEGQDDQLREGTAKVRAMMGKGVLISDREIEDSLWHYYYDVEKTVNYLTQKAAKAVAKKTTKAETEAINDCPWLSVPEDRQGEIMIKPMYPRGGLPGGSPSQESSGNPSKLAALAAARRKKENDKPVEGGSNSSVALLDKLGRNGPFSAASTVRSVRKEQTTDGQNPSPLTHKLAPRKYPSKRYAGLDDSEPVVSKARVESPKPLDAAPGESSESPAIPAALPSAFARTILGLPAAVSRDTDPHCALEDSLHQLHMVDYALPHGSLTETESNAFTGPSPDDVILKAQNSKVPKAAKAASAKGLSEVTKAVDNVAITEAAKIKSKNLDVLAEFQNTTQKPAANFVVIGHVDAGKSTLMGRLLYDLKVVDQRTLDKYRKEAESIGKSSFALAWVLDQGSDERDQGVTIDIGMNKFETDQTAFTILDAPGHRDFIPNMIAGASQADFAVLVIDASTGSFESGLKGQTKEHALLVRSMGVQRLIIAINKLDTLSWSKDRFTEIQQQVSAFLTAAGFQLKNLAFLPCSGLTGGNIVRKVTDPRASWYSGPPLISLLESSEPFARALKKPLRLTIDDIFRGGVRNPLSVSGRIDAGSIQVGDVVVIVPSSESATIKGIEIDFQPNDWAVAGQNVILHLADMDQKYLKLGDVICSPTAPMKPVQSFTMKILAFEHILPMAVEVHRGRLCAPGKVSRLVAVLDKSTGQPVEGAKKKVKIVKPGSVARVVIEVEEAVPLEVGARVVLRAGGETVGAGLLE